MRLTSSSEPAVWRTGACKTINVGLNKQVAARALLHSRRCSAKDTVKVAVDFFFFSHGIPLRMMAIKHARSGAHRQDTKKND